MEWNLGGLYVTDEFNDNFERILINFFLNYMIFEESDCTTLNKVTRINNTLPAHLLQYKLSHNRCNSKSFIPASVLNVKKKKRNTRLLLFSSTSYNDPQNVHLLNTQ